MRQKQVFPVISPVDNRVGPSYCTLDARGIGKEEEMIFRLAPLNN